MIRQCVKSGLLLTKKGYKQNDILVTKHCIAWYKGDNLLITNNTRDLKFLGRAGDFWLTANYPYNLDVLTNQREYLT